MHIRPRATQPPGTEGPDNRGQRLFQVGLGQEERRHPRAVERIAVGQLRDRLLAQRDAIAEASALDIARAG